MLDPDTHNKTDTETPESDTEIASPMKHLGALSFFQPPSPVTPAPFFPNKFNRFEEAEKSSAYMTTPGGHFAPTPTARLNDAAIENVDGHSPFDKIGTPGSTEKSPALTIYTKSGEKLYLKHKIGNVAIYARKDDPTESRLSLKLTQSFTELHLAEISKVKGQNYDSETFGKVTKKKYRSQIRVMGFSATDVTMNVFNLEAVNETLKKMSLTLEEENAIRELFEDFAAEWLHLIDYAKVGEKLQIPENLVFGDWEANSLMMAVEAFTSNQIEEGKHVKIEVEAAIYNTHITKKEKEVDANIPKEIIMRVQIEGDEHPTIISINPFEKEQPIVQSGPYFALSQNKKILGSGPK